MIELPTSGVSQPVLLMSRGILFDTWNATSPLLEGPKQWVDIASAPHFIFSDAPTLFQAAGQDPEPLAELLGAIAPEEMVNVLVDCAISWLSAVFAEEGEGSWEAVEELEFSEVSVLQVDNL